MPEEHAVGTDEPRLSWDPRYQPCIPTVASDGSLAHRSLCALFRDAEKLSDLDCVTPGEMVVLTEHLLAICFASRNCPFSPEEWLSWITEKRDLAPVADWLTDQPADAWDLFHPKTPFGQNVGLKSQLQENGTGPAQLVIERAGDYNQHLDHHHLEHGEPLPAAEAFRALLTQHVYAPYGRGRLSGDEELGKWITYMASGRLLGRIRVVAIGRTLGETLRLNLYPPEGPGGPLNTSWTTEGIERRSFEKKAKPRAPRSSADLHSALYRSILMRPSRDERGQIVVDRVLIGAGEELDLDPERHLQDAVFTQTLGGQSKPLWPSPTRALWRDAHALYSAVDNVTHGLYARLYSLRTAMARREGAPYRLRAVGLITKQSLPADWLQGSYPFGPFMVGHLHRASYRGSVIAEYVARMLKSAAVVAFENVYSAARAADEPGGLERFDAREKFWPDAAPSFDLLLDRVVEEHAIDDDDPVSEPLLDYAETLRTMARAHLVRRLDSLPPNNRSYQARARAEECFDRGMRSAKAPAELRGEIAHD
ncbi:type I-E CRISPR-associated protein Cse1/CasA [Streptomyces sp. NPDC046203]|uniref:type I-E CRISPR-associated protein Cse1/CasA n=1 Tax=Streptomyces sp. NPDC046203 TaxID=3154602 RepID=UPI0034073B52